MRRINYKLVHLENPPQGSTHYRRSDGVASSPRGKERHSTSPFAYPSPSPRPRLAGDARWRVELEKRSLETESSEPRASGVKQGAFHFISLQFLIYLYNHQPPRKALSLQASYNMKKFEHLFILKYQ